MTLAQERRTCVAAGLTDHQVVQRDAATGATVRLTGPAGPAASAPVRICGEGDGVPVVADADGWHADLVLPVGGPYRVEARWADGTTSVVADDVLVGDLWLLAGQSNMEGCGRLDEPLEPPHPLVHVHDPEARWRVASEPLHRRGLAFASTDPADANGAGLGLAFGRAMVARTGVPVGLVATAVSATSTDHWDPARPDGLWARMVTLTGAAGGRLAGVLWYQGESETEPDRLAGYPAALEAIATGFRRQFGAGCRLVHVQIGRFLAGDWTPPEQRHDVEWSEVRRMQAASLAFDAMVPAIDGEMTDFIHLSTAGLRRLGRRLAAVASGDRGPLSVAAVRRAGADVVRVHVDGVVGALRPGPVQGFSLHDAAGSVEPCKAATSGPASIDVRLPRPARPGDALRYGYGMDPVCDAVDGDDMPLPASGPLPLSPQPS